MKREFLYPRLWPKLDFVVCSIVATVLLILPAEAQSGATNGSVIQKPRTLSLVSTMPFGSSPGSSGFTVTYQISDKVPLNLQSGSYNPVENLTLETTIAVANGGYTFIYTTPYNGKITNGGSSVIVSANGQFPDKMGDSPAAEAAYLDTLHFNEYGTYLPVGTVVTVTCEADDHAYSVSPTNPSNGQPTSFTLSPTFNLDIRWNVVKSTGSTSNPGSWGAAANNPGPTQIN